MNHSHRFRRPDWRQWSCGTPGCRRCQSIQTTNLDCGRRDARSIRCTWQGRRGNRPTARQGLGAASARALADHGAVVAVLDLDHYSAEARTQGFPAGSFGIGCDVSSPERSRHRQPGEWTSQANQPADGSRAEPVAPLKRYDPTQRLKCAIRRLRVRSARGVRFARLFAVDLGGCAFAHSGDRRYYPARQVQ